MHNVDTKRAVILITVCGILAAAISDVWNSFHTAPAKAIQARRIAVEQKTAELAAYTAKYVSSASPRKPNVKLIAVAVLSSDGQLTPALNGVLTDRFQTDSAKTLCSFFRPAFVADGLFANALTKPTEVFETLGLAKSVNAVLLGRQTVQYSTDPSMENVMTANMRFELTAVSLADGQSRSWNFVANGSGFKQNEARAMAEERLIKQMSKDNTLSFTP